MNDKEAKQFAIMMLIAFGTGCIVLGDLLLHL